MVKTTNNSNSENQQVDTSSLVYREELKSSFSEGVEQRKRRSDLLNALTRKNLESTKELIKQVERLDIVQLVRRKKDDCIVAIRPLLHFFIKNAFEGDSWFNFYQDVLLEQDGKIDINASISSDDTALSYACREGKVDVARFLCNYGADPNIGEPDAMQIATDKGNTELIDLFNQKLRTGPKRLNDMYELFGTQEKAEPLNRVKGKVNRLNRVNPDLLHILLEKRIIHDGNGVDTLFDTQGKVNRLNRVNLDLFQTLLEKGIIRYADEINTLFGTQEKVDRLNGFYKLDLFQTLLEKRIIHRADEIDTSFDTQEKVDRLNDFYKLDLFQTLLEKRIIRSTYDIERLFSTQEEVDRLNGFYKLDLFQTLLEKRIIQHAYDIDTLFGTQEKVDRLNDFYKLDLFQTLLKKRIIRGANDIDMLFGTQEKVDRLNRVNLDLFQTLLEKRIIRSTYDMDRLFSTQEKVDRLNRVNLDLFQTLLEKRIIRGANDIDTLFDTQEKVDRLGNVELDLLKILINRNFIQDIDNLSELLKNKDFITNVKDNPFLTKTLLNIDGVASIMIDLIRHPKYTESSGHLLRNYKLALALLNKGAIENITIDYLFDSERIKNDLKDNKFVKNTVITKLFNKFVKNTVITKRFNDDRVLKKTEIYYPCGNDYEDGKYVSNGTQEVLTADDMLDNVFARSRNDVENNPMPKLKDLSLEAFVKAMPQSPDL